MLKDFHEKRLREIKWWAWAATVLPIVALAGLFFLEAFGLDTYINTALTIGATAMFFVSVVWWWWAIWTIAKITGILSQTYNKFDDVKKDLKFIRNDIKKNY